MSNNLIGDTFNSRKFFKKKSDNFDYHEPLPSSLKKKILHYFIQNLLKYLYSHTIKLKMET